MKVKDLLKVTSNRIIGRNDYTTWFDTEKDITNLKFFGDCDIRNLKCDVDFSGKPVMIAIINY